MRRKSNALTAASLSSRSKGKYHDGKGHGLIFVVKDSGAKSWVQRVNVHGRRKELGLGAYPIVSLAKAREKALENKRLIQEGKDPKTFRDALLAVPTFEDAAYEVYQQNLPTWSNGKHGDQFINTLKTYAFPIMGSKKVSEVDSTDILNVLLPIWLTKQDTASRLKQRMAKIMKWAKSNRWRMDNPVDGIEEALPKQTRKVKHRKSLPYQQVPECLAAVNKSGAAPTTKLALEFLALTASRSREVREADWSEFDLEADVPVWIVPAERMKAREAHRVPLSCRALEVLKEAKSYDDGSGLVFPGSKRGKPMSDRTMLKLVREQGFDVDIHGFRTSFKTWALEQTSYPNEVSERALAHTIPNKAEAAYARSDLLEKRVPAMEEWSAFLSTWRDM